MYDSFKEPIWQYRESLRSPHGGREGIFRTLIGLIRIIGLICLMRRPYDPLPWGGAWVM